MGTVEVAPGSGAVPGERGVGACDDELTGTWEFVGAFSSLSVLQPLHTRSVATAATNMLCKHFMYAEAINRSGNLRDLAGVCRAPEFSSLLPQLRGILFRTKHFHQCPGSYAKEFGAAEVNLAAIFTARSAW